MHNAVQAEPTITPEIMRDTERQVTCMRVPSWMREDARQEGFVRILKARGRFDSLQASFRHFCRAQARGAALDFMRREDWMSRYRRKQVEREGAEDFRPCPLTPELIRTLPARTVSPERGAQGAEVRRMLGRLPSRWQAVLTHRYWSERTQEETASAMGLSTSRISQIEREALRRLRAYATWRRG